MGGTFIGRDRVAGVVGPVVAGHLAVFDGAADTLRDGGAIPSGSGSDGLLSGFKDMTLVTVPLGAVPTSATVAVSGDVYVTRIWLNNTTNAAKTVTVTDNQGSPVPLLGPAFELPALATLSLPLDGLHATSGLKWSASASGVTGAIVGYQP